MGLHASGLVVSWSAADVNFLQDMLLFEEILLSGGVVSTRDEFSFVDSTALLVASASRGNFRDDDDSLSTTNSAFKDISFRKVPTTTFDTLFASCGSGRVSSDFDISFDDGVGVAVALTVALAVALALAGMELRACRDAAAASLLSASLPPTAAAAR